MAAFRLEVKDGKRKKRENKVKKKSTESKQKPMIFGCRVVLPLPAGANVRQMGSSVCLCADDMCLCSSAVFFLIYTFGWQVDCDITFPHTIKHQRAIIYKTMESRVLGKRNSMYKCGLLVEIVDVD